MLLNTHILKENGLNSLILTVISFLGILISIYFIEYVWVAIVLSLLLIAAVCYGEKFLISFAVVTLFTLVGDVSQDLRLFIHLLDFMIFGYVFLKTYGFDFKRYPEVPKVIVVFIILYYVSMLISTIFSSHTAAGFNKIGRQTAFFILAYTFYGIIFDKNYVKLIVLSTVLASFVLALSVIGQFILSDFSIINVATGGANRYHGLIGNILTTTTYLVVAYPFILYKIIRSETSAERLIYWVAILIFSFALLLSASRSPVIAVLFNTTLTLYFLNKRLLKKFGISLVIIIALIVFIPPLSETISILLRLESGLSLREYFWAVAVNIIKENWLIGIGPGSYGYEMYNYFPVLIGSWVGDVLTITSIVTEGSNSAHNFFLVFFSDMGIPGLLLSIALPVIYFVIARNTVEKVKSINSPDYYFVLIIAISGGSLFFRALIDGIGILSYGFITNDMPFWLMFMSLMYYNISTDKYEIRNSGLSINKSMDN
ncbi:MAG: hypothetical protein Kow0098_16960 [Ignavibacteriaceae bacterium]